MSLTVTPMNSKSPSFGGIVRVGKVVLDGSESRNFKVIDTAVKRLKAVLMRQTDTKDTFVRNSAFRKDYSNFDFDYIPPYCKLNGDTRHIMSKVRPKGSQETFIVTGHDADMIADSGVDIGRKRALERVSEGYKNYGAEENARVDYRDTKDLIADKFHERKLHPQVTIYTETDRKGVIRLKGAKLDNDIFSGVKFDLSSDAKKIKKKITDSQAEPVAKSMQKPKEISSIPKEIKSLPKESSIEENPLLKELEAKSWDSVLKPAKKKPRKVKENPNQMNFFDKLV